MLPGPFQTLSAAMSSLSSRPALGALADRLGGDGTRDLIAQHDRDHSQLCGVTQESRIRSAACCKVRQERVSLLGQRSVGVARNHPRVVEQFFKHTGPALGKAGRQQALRGKILCGVDDPGNPMKTMLLSTCTA